MKRAFWCDALDPPRSRLLYLLIAVATIPIGLLSRKIPGLPAVLSKALGDALYATMSFWLAGMLLPAASTVAALVLAALFCFAVELSQLWHPPLLDAIRATRLGGLALGHGFHGMDFLYYVMGALFGAGIERLIRYVESRRRLDRKT